MLMLMEMMLMTMHYSVSVNYLHNTTITISNGNVDDNVAADHHKILPLLLVMVILMTVYSVSADHLHNTGNSFLAAWPLLLCLQPCGKL